MILQFGGMGAKVVMGLFALVLFAVFAFLVGPVVAQIPICTPGGECTPVDYVALAGEVAVGCLVAGAGGWLIRTARTEIGWGVA